MIPLEDLVNQQEAESPKGFTRGLENTVKDICAFIPDNLRDFNTLEFEDSDGDIKVVEVEIVDDNLSDEAKYWKTFYKHMGELLGNVQEYLSDLGEKQWEHVETPYLIKASQLMADVHSFRAKYEDDYDEGEWVQTGDDEWVKPPKKTKREKRK